MFFKDLKAGDRFIVLIKDIDTVCEVCGANVYRKLPSPLSYALVGQEAVIFTAIREIDSLPIEAKDNTKVLKLYM